MWDLSLFQCIISKFKSCKTMKISDRRACTHAAIQIGYVLKSDASPFPSRNLFVTAVQGAYTSYYDHYNILGWAGLRSRYSDWLRAGRSGDRIPVLARFSATVQTGPGGHPASCTMNGYRVFPGGKKRPGHDADPSPPSSAVVTKG
jgi:hypothetical protein